MLTSKTTALGDQAGQRSQGYWLLSKLFLELPTPDRLHALHCALTLLKDDGSPLLEAVDALLEAVGQALLAPEATAVAYTRGLVVVAKDSHEALPFESHVRENRLPGDATQAIRSLMSEAGYADIAPESSSPDHLGAELRFMALLCHDECQAWQSGDLDGAVANLRRQNVLLNAHLVQWAPDYCQGLAARSDDAYIQAIARLTRQSLIDDREALTEISSEVDTFLSASIR